MRLSRRNWLGALAALALPRAARAQAKRVFDVRSYGAKGDGRTLDTKAVQAATAAMPISESLVMVILLLIVVSRLQNRCRSHDLKKQQPFSPQQGANPGAMIVLEQ